MAPDARIYCGNLPPGAREEDVRSVFACFGSLRAVDVKAPAGVPPYAFVEFESVREAEDAVRERNGYEHEGAKLRVEFSKGGADRSRQAQRRSDYRIVISNLPQSGSWQDLKDACRDFGNVYYASVQRDGTGVVEFAHSSDMRRAADKLHGTTFRSHTGETAVIRVQEDRRSRSRSPRRRYSRSPRRHSRSPRRHSRSPRRRSRSPRRYSRSPVRRRDSPSPRRGRSPRRD